MDLVLSKFRPLRPGQQVHLTVIKVIGSHAARHTQRREKADLWKARAPCATVRPKEPEVRYEPARSRQQQGRDGDAENLVGLCADAPTDGRAAAPHRGEWRPVLHVVR